MSPIRRLSTAEQVASQMRAEIASGHWGTRLPGVLKLAAEFKTSKDSVRAALQMLEQEGVLRHSGSGRHRQLQLHAPAGRRLRSRLRVGVLLSRPLQVENGVSQLMLLRLLHEIEQSGHPAFFAPRSQLCLKHSVPRISRLVQETRADAWVVVDASEELMRWFSSQPFPAIALGGRFSEVPLARVAVDLTEGFLQVLQTLKKLGHRRIVVLVPRVWRLPVPGRLVSALLDEFRRSGSAAPEYHLPDWEPTAAGFNALLKSLFRVTPPTALVVIEPGEAVAVLSFLAQRGLRIPRDVSLVCRHRDAALDLCEPPIAHLSENATHLIQHIVKWVNGAARGQAHRHRIVSPSEFFPGGSIAPPVRL